MRKIIIGLIFAFIIGITTGCSGSGDTPITPASTTETETTRGPAQNNHCCLGLWQMVVDPEAKTLDAFEMRETAMHLNALFFLEPPPLVNLTLESLEFNGNIIEVDIGLKHPFLGLNEFTGFDVCGILISNGEVTGYMDPDLYMAGDGDFRLLNPDGYSRWWNPTEFPVNDGSMFCYKDGLLGTPDSVGQYNSTINAYKYFCDDLEPNDPVSLITLENRGMFSAGQKNIRHYTIDMGTAGLIFNYAIDACWEFPTGGSPWTVPDDFPPGANRPEAWRVSITETENTLWNDGEESGGDLSLAIDVYDWYNAGLNTVKVESPGNFSMAESSTPTGGAVGYSIYEVEILDAVPSPNSIDILISVESDELGYGSLLPGKMVTSYFTSSVNVSSQKPLSIWPTMQGNSANTGHVEGLNGPSGVLGAPNWFNDEAVWNALYPFLNEDTAFISTVGSGSTNGYTAAINLSDGSTKWTKAFGTNPNTFLACKGLSADGSIVFCAQSDNGTLYGLDAETGDELWNTPGSMYASAFISLDLNGNFIVPVGGAGFRSIAPQTGTVNWTAGIGNSSYSTPAIGADGTIYCYARVSGYPRYLYALDPATGDDKWSTNPSIGNAVNAPTVHTNGTILIHSYSNLSCFQDNGTDASIVWQQPYPRSWYSSVAVAPSGDIYLVEETHTLRRIDPTDGHTIDSASGVGEYGTRPAIGDDGLVYIGAENYFRVFNPDCTEVWSWYGGSSYIKGPAIGQDGWVYALNTGGIHAWHD